MLTGTCLCGAVAWEIDGPCEWMAHCHCSMCRKAHGTAYATFVTFPRDGFRWLRGEDRIARYESSPGSFRSFCAGCGSKLPATEPFAYAPAAPLQGDVGMRPLCHMFVASKAPWHEITDDAQRFDEYPPGAGQPVPRQRSTEPAEGKIRGSCLCGAVAYEIDGPLGSGQIVSCHCSRCRRARAAPHGSNMFIEDDSFRWLRGSDRLAYYKLPEAQRFGQSFCTTCGSPLPPLSTPTGRRVIPAGSLDDDPGLRGTVHIMVASKSPWEQLTGPDPRHDEYPPADWNPTARPHHP